MLLSMANPLLNGQSRLLDSTGRPIDPSHIDDGFGVPHVTTFTAIFGSAYKTYVHDRWDEALKQGRDNALVMRRDAFLMGLLQERKLATASLKWHLEVDNEDDPNQKLVKDGMTKILQSIPKFQRLRMSLLEAIWYGRYAVQLAWEWKQLWLPTAEGGLFKSRVLTVKKHVPVSGDKIGHKFDGTPYLMINAGQAQEYGVRAEIIQGTLARGLVLEGSWRERFLIHTHESDDQDFFEPEKGEAVFGVGIRDRLFWLDWIRREYLAWVVDFLERVGLGVTIWYYDASNPTSKTETEKAAKTQTRRSIILCPMWPDSRGGVNPMVERVETPTAGAEVLIRLQEHIEEIEERYVIGQTLSSDSEGNGLGGSGVANLHGETKQKIVAFDAANLAETLTGSDHEPGLVNTILRWTYPWADFPVRFVHDVDTVDPAAKLEAVVSASGIGVDFKKNEVRALTGMSDPAPGDEVVGGQVMAAPGEDGEPGEPGGEEEGGDNPFGGESNDEIVTAESVPDA